MSKLQYVQPSLSDLSSRSGNKVTLSWESVPKLKGGKGNPMQGKIRKISTADVTISGTGVYASRKVDEGEFSSSDEVQQRKWGTRIGNTCVIEHNGHMYIEFLVDGTPKSTYKLDGKEIAKDDVTGLNPSKRDSNVLICTVKAENIKLLTDPE